MPFGLVGALLLALPLSAPALAPHEVLVLVNQRSPASQEVANHFIEKRDIPRVNVVYLDLPKPLGSPLNGISAADFKTLIWEPVQTALRERRLQDIIQAWVYSADFPTFVRAGPLVSIHGFTFTHTQMPPKDLVSGGTYKSPLFAAPATKEEPLAGSRTLSRFRAGLGAQMPIPSMSLAVTGTDNANTVAEAVAVIERGVASDYTAPKGTIYLVKNLNVRSTARDWQFDAVERELKALKVKVSVAATYPSGNKPILGLQAGASSVPTGQFKNFLPGAMAEHLTSFAANFGASQTKLTAWLSAGATASAGTVTEPRSIWTKFPHAAFYVHYARGCSILESFYQSVASPHQLLMVGEPLARPFGERIPIKVTPQHAGSEWRFKVDLRGWPAERSVSYRYIVDDVLRSPASLDPELQVPDKMLAAGWHTLRVFVQVNEPVGHYTEQVLPFEVVKPGRGVALQNSEKLRTLPDSQSVQVAVEAQGAPQTVKLYKGLVELATAEGGVLSFDPIALGRGPSRIQVYARYEDGEIVRSREYPVNVVDAL